MLELQRLLIENHQSNLFRVLNFGTGIDGHQEPYFKACFPYIKGSCKLLRADKPGKVSDNFMDTLDSKVEKSINELSYHYSSGICHFKSHNKPINQIKNLPTIRAKSPLKLFTVYIFDLNSVPNFNNKLSKKDFILPNKFNQTKGRIIDLYLSEPTRSPKLVDKNDINYFDQYEFIDNDLNIRLSIVDYEFTEKPNLTGIAIHKPDDPQGSFF